MADVPVTFNEILIAFVRERPALWDSQNPLYRDKIVKNRLWDEIGVLMQQYGESDLKGKWKHLRDRYTKSIRDDGGRSMQFMGKKAPWNLLPQLEFLRDAVSHRSGPENSTPPYYHHYHPHHPTGIPGIMHTSQNESGSVRSYDGDHDNHNNHCNHDIDDNRTLDMKDSGFVVRSPGSSDTAQDVHNSNYTGVKKNPGPSRPSKREREDDIHRALLTVLKEKKTEPPSTPEDFFFLSVAKESQQLSTLRRAKLKLKVQELLVQLLEEEERSK